MTNSVFTGNAATQHGGAILSDRATVTVTNCTFSTNQSNFGGGSAIDNTGTLTVTGSIFTGNASVDNTQTVPAYGGGAISNEDGVALKDGGATITNSTFVGNSITNVEGGAAISSRTSSAERALNLINDTITGNSADFYGAGGVTIVGFVNVTNTIISGNTAGTPQLQNVAPPPAFSSATTSIIGGSPLLGTLGNHGGPTQTIPLLPGSPAIGAGTTGAGIPTTDQRGVARTGHNDIGAFQSQGFTIMKTGGDGQSTHVGQPFASPLTVTVAANQAGAPWNEPVQGAILTITVPSNGPSASFSNPTVTMPANGQVSLTATANAVVGGPYTVKMGVSSLLTVSFSLTNTPAPAHTTYTVGSIADNAGGQTNVAACTTPTNTTCTLRDALTAAVSGTDTIVFNNTGRGTITLASNLPVLTQSVTVTGPGASLLSINSYPTQPGNGLGTKRAFKIASGTTLNLSGVTIANGFLNDGTGNDWGAGIYVSANATLAVTNSAFSTNYAVNGGGAIYNAGTLMVTNSTFTNNQGDEDGGAIANTGTLTVTNSTFTSNLTPFHTGAAIANTGTLTVTNCTITGNTSNFPGGGVASTGGTARLTNTIVAGSQTFTQPSIADLAGTITSGGHNLFGDISGATITLQSGDLVNPIPLVGTLGSYGGTTQTIPLLPGSPALNAGGSCSSTDQRGVARPQADACDIGAFESRGFTIVKASGDNQSVLPGHAFSPLDVLVLGSNGEPTVGGVVTFTGPASGAGITPSTMTATIAATGHASVTPTANGTLGTYSVTAGARGTIPATAAFTLTNSVPPPFAVTAITPASGPVVGGATVTLTGTAFAAGVTVNIGDAVCTNVQVVTSTTLTCTTGAHAQGIVDVVVTGGGGSTTLAGGYAYGVIPPQSRPNPAAETPGSPIPPPGVHAPTTTGTMGGPVPIPPPISRPADS